jgi:hypothetical protein
VGKGRPLIIRSRWPLRVAAFEISRLVRHPYDSCARAPAAR